VASVLNAGWLVIIKLRRKEVMATGADKLALEIRSWPDLEKLRLVYAILSDLEKLDPEIDGIGLRKLGSDGQLIRLAAFRLCLTKM
jgi:hypothetical protein